MLLKKETGKHKYSYPEFLRKTRLNNESRDKMPTFNVGRYSAALISTPLSFESTRVSSSLSISLFISLYRSSTLTCLVLTVLNTRASINYPFITPITVIISLSQHNYCHLVLVLHLSVDVWMVIYPCLQNKT